MNIETYLKAQTLHDHIKAQEELLVEMQSLSSEFQESGIPFFAEFKVFDVGTIMIRPEFIDKVLDTTIRLQSDYIVTLKAEFYQL